MIYSFYFFFKRGSAIFSVEKIEEQATEQKKGLLMKLKRSKYSCLVN
jgi:hypothetical protein